MCKSSPTFFCRCLFQAVPARYSLRYLQPPSKRSVSLSWAKRLPRVFRRTIHTHQHCILTVCAAMEVNKSGSDTHVSYNDLNGNDVELRNTAKLRGTEHDENDMRTLGKTQQLNVSREAFDTSFESCSDFLCSGTSDSCRFLLFHARQ
jgi:hypothetical protein